MILTTLLFCLTAIMCDAMGDALNHTGRKRQGHFLQGLATAFHVNILLPFALSYGHPWWVMIYIGAMYILARFVFFNPVWNLMVGQPIGYIGTVSLTDRFMRKLAAPDFAWWWARFICLIAVVFIIINLW